jgi:tRNA-dihydrouridine synthase B
LLKDEQLVADILRAVTAAVDVPVTLKIRTGWDAELKNAVRIAKMAEDCGIALLSVHGRTRADAFRGEAEYETIAAVKQAVGIPVLANGDIDSVHKAKAVLHLTGADGVMIGRAAQGNPWIFNAINHFLLTGEELPKPDIDTVQRTLNEHVQALHQFYGDFMGVRIARKHLGWYLGGQGLPKHSYQEIILLESSQLQLGAINTLFDNFERLKENTA